MTYDGQEVAQVRNPMLIVSAATWVLLLADPGGAVMSTHEPDVHSGSDGGDVAPHAAGDAPARLPGGGLGV